MKKLTYFLCFIQSILALSSQSIQINPDQNHPLTIEQIIAERFKPLSIDEYSQQVIAINKGNPTGNYRIIGERWQDYNTITSTWDFTDSILFTYNSNGLNDLKFKREYDNITNTWNNYDRYLYQYTPEGWLSQYVYQIWNGAAWDNQAKSNYTYNSSGLMTEKYDQTWNAGNWENTYRYTYSYNSNNLEDVSTYFNWNNISSQWQPSNQTNISYDANNNLTSVLYKNWNGSAWDNVSLTNYQYNASNKNISLRYYTWDNIGNAWKNDYRDTTIYNAGTSVREAFTWNAGTSSWDNYSKQTIIYDANELPTQITAQVWDNVNTMWLNHYRISYNYDANQNQTLYHYETWDNTNSVWVKQYKLNYTFNGDNYNLTYLYETWDNVNTMWVPYYRKFYWYETNPFASIADNSQQLQFHAYPNPTNELLRVQLTLTSPQDVQIKLFDLQGNLVYQQQYSNTVGQVNFPVDIQAFSSGIYVLQVQTANGIVQQKMIKE